MNAEQHDQERTDIPVGFVLPSDNGEAGSAIAQALEDRAMQARAAAFIARLDTRQREVFAAPCPV